MKRLVNLVKVLTSNSLEFNDYSNSKKSVLYDLKNAAINN